MVVGAAVAWRVEPALRRGAREQESEWVLDLAQALPANRSELERAPQERWVEVGSPLGRLRALRLAPRRSKRQGGYRRLPGSA